MASTRKKMMEHWDYENKWDRLLRQAVDGAGFFISRIPTGQKIIHDGRSEIAVIPLHIPSKSVCLSAQRRLGLE